MSRSSAFVSNTMASLLLQAVTIFTGFMVPRAIIGCYGSSVNGLVSSLTQFVSYISLVEAGISAAAVFALYKPLGLNDMKGVSVVASAARRFYYRSGWIFVALIAVLAFAYPLVVDCDNLSNLQVMILVFSLGSTGFLDFFTLAKYRALLTASQRNWAIQLATIVYKILNTVVILVMALLHAPIELTYVAAILPVIVRTVALSLFTRRVFPDVTFDEDITGFKLEQRWDAFYLQVLGAVQSGAPMILATFLLRDLSLVSVFSVYMLVANGLQSVCNSLSQGTQASFGDVIARGQMDTLRKAFAEFQVMAYSLSAVVCAVGVVVVETFIGLYTRGVNDVSYSYPLVGFLAILNVLLYHLKTPQGVLIAAAGKYHDTRVQVTIQTLILIVGAIAGGIWWGLPGILLGSLLSNFYRDVDLAIWIPRHVTEEPPSKTFKNMFVSVLEFALIIAPFATLHWTGSSWIEFLCLFAMACCWGVVVVVGFSLVFCRPQFEGVLRRIRHLLTRRG